MMDENAATVPNFVTILLDYANGSLKRAVDGLTDEQVYHQPTEDTNNIAWLAWHMNRWKDWQGSLVSGEEQVWIRDGWCDRFGIPAERTGIGDGAGGRVPPGPPVGLHRGRAHHLHRAGPSRRRSWRRWCTTCQAAASRGPSGAPSSVSAQTP